MTATCHTFDPLTYCDMIEREITRFASVARGADPAAPVATCPGWTIADLIEHAGSVHRWAETQVRVLTQERIPGSKISLGIPEDRAALPDWLAAGAASLVPTLRGADQDAAMWAWGSDRHVRFWPRRMVHETTVHRADAEITLGVEPQIDAGVAVDGVDEFLDNLPYAASFAPNVKELRGDGEALAFRCTEAAWVVRLVPEGFTWEHAEGEAGATVSGAAADLLLFFYGRRTEGLETAGDATLLRRWRENSSI